jgi:conjugal transfer/type IV secretion protein DotA/TraY
MTVINSYSALSVSKAVASYTLLPDFWSRFVGFMPRFGLMAYLMAIIFESIRLLPKGHPFTQASQINKYRIRDVLAMAANNLHGGFKNSDQYIVFGMFVLGVVLLLLQFFFLCAMVMTRTAEAAIPFVGMFITVNPQTDIAHLMLDKVFGIPAFFNSCFDPAINSDPACAGYRASADFPNPFQQAMQALFNFYTFGMLMVAGLLVFYYIVAMIIETANTGIPFGSRFQSIFTPIRLVLAVILLLPLAYGYNTGQYIILLSAKWGSALATNAWLIFNDHSGDNPMGMEPKQLVGKPKVGEISSVVNFMYLAKTCSAAYKMGSNVTIQPYLVTDAAGTATAASVQLTAGYTFDSAKSFTKNADVQIIFGEKNTDYKNYKGFVKPYCGVIAMPALSKNVTGINEIYNVYFKNVLDIWFNADIAGYGTRMACVLKYKGKDDCVTPAPVTTAWDAPNNKVAGQNFYIGVLQTAQANFAAQLNTQINTMRTTTNPATSMDVKTLLLGWGGAGVWFNKIMAFNGAMVDALHALPTPTKYPMVMEQIAAKKRQVTPNIAPKDVFSMELSSGGKSQPMDRYMADGDLGGSLAGNVEIANVLVKVFKAVQDNPGTSRPKTANTDSIIKNFVSLLFGQTGIFDFRANAEVFPLAKLAMLGRELIDKTVIMLASRTLMAGVGAVAGADLGPLGDAMKNIGPGIGTFATMGVSIGILLYYVVPLMPFIYFFFAVGRWVKSIFEAMVAVPLWALAHLRLGGEGIPGPAAGQGYFLILEIFLRPILTLFGLMASIGCFMALCNGLDSVFNLAILNTGGFDMTTLSSGGVDNFANSMRDGMDALFYTALYAILIYMIATSSFKLIDLIPNSIMRWAGTNTAGFNDKVEPIDQIEYQLVYKADGLAKQINSGGKTVEGYADIKRDNDIRNAKP